MHDVSDRKHVRKRFFGDKKGARSDTAVMSGEVRSKIKMVRNCCLARLRFGVVAVAKAPSKSFRVEFDTYRAFRR